MVKKKKLVEGVDDRTWKRFIGYCKIQDHKVGEMLNKVLENFLKNKIK